MQVKEVVLVKKMEKVWLSVMIQLEFITLENIIFKGAEKNFYIYSHGRIDTLSTPYDKHSLMHYDNKAFTKNFEDTLQARDNPKEYLGGSSLSITDIKQILILYKCKRRRYKLRNGKKFSKLKCTAKIKKKEMQVYSECD